MNEIFIQWQEPKVVALERSRRGIRIAMPIIMFFELIIILDMYFFDKILPGEIWKIMDQAHLFYAFFMVWPFSFIFIPYLARFSNRKISVGDRGVTFTSGENTNHWSWDNIIDFGISHSGNNNDAIVFQFKTKWRKVKVYLSEEVSADNLLSICAANIKKDSLSV